jgi:hypothetical protein
MSKLFLIKKEQVKTNCLAFIMQPREASTDFQILIN